MPSLVDDVQVNNSAVTRNRVVTVLILCIINTLNYMDRYIIFGILSDVQEFYKLSNGQAGLLQTVFLAFYIATSFIIGFFENSISKKYSIATGVIIWSFCSFLGTLVPAEDYILFYASRSLIGVGEATISTLGFTVIGDLFVGTARTRSLSFFMAAMPFGSGLGYTIGPPMVRFMGTWQWALRITPFFGIICSFFLLLIMKEPKPGQAEIEERRESHTKRNSRKLIINKDGMEEEPSFVRRFYNENLKYFFRRKSFITSTMAYTAVSFVFGGLAVWLPPYIKLINNGMTSAPGYISNDTVLGLVLGIATVISGLVGVIVGGEFTAYFRSSNRPIELYMCVGCCLLSTITLYISIASSLTSLTITWISMSITLFLLSLMWSPNGDLLMLVIGPLHRLRASAIQILSIHAMGDAISPVIIGYISDYLKVDTSDSANIRSLYLTLYVIPGFLLLAAFLYVISLKFYGSDYESTVNETIQLMNDTSS